MKTMYHYVTCVCVAIACILVTADSFYHNLNNRPSLSMPCLSTMRPCKMQISVRHFNGTAAGSVASESCRCSGQQSCPSDWSSSTHMISRNLISTTQIMTMDMMFCNRVRPRRRCRSGETALMLSGHLAIPTTIEQYRCNCNSNQALQLKQRWMGNYDFKTYHSYICGDQQPTCTQGQTCLETNSTAVTYQCKCPGLSGCRERQEAHDRGNGVYVGFCQR